MMMNHKRLVIIGLLGILPSCGILIEDQSVPASGEVKTETPTPDVSQGDGIHAELGERSQGTQKVVVKSHLEPAGFSSASQFELSHDPTEISLVPLDYALVAPQVAAADKSIACSTAPGVVRCLVYGLNQNVIPNGELAILVFQVVNPGIERPRISIQNVVMSRVNGTAIALPKTAQIRASGERSLERTSK